MKTGKLIGIMALGLLLGGCQQSAQRMAAGYLGAVEPGTLVTTRQPLTIPVDSARAGIQHGKAVDTRDFERYDPYCELEVRSVARDRAATVPPGRFRVTRVQNDRTSFGQRLPAAGVMLASIDDVSVALLAQGAGADKPWLFKTILSLESDTYPDILRLTCGQWWPQYYLARHLTMEEFEAAVGDVITLSPPLSGS